MWSHTCVCIYTHVNQYTLVNQCLITGIISENLKLVIPLHKKDDKMLSTNYRPISLLPSITKIIGEVAHNQINSYFTSHNLFYKHQYGFRSKLSTELALHLTDKITTEMDSYNIPLDNHDNYLALSKSFNTLNLDIL